MPDRVRIVFCVLNWGLGHATRSIPVIRKLLNTGCEVRIASDGDALKLLQLTFPDLVSYTLPSYNISYPTTSVFLNALTRMHRLTSAVKKERQCLAQFHSADHFDAVISDNRYGCFLPDIPSVCITHQLRNLTRSPLMSCAGAWMIDRYLRHFDIIWVPDMADRRLSGKLSDIQSDKVRYVGYLSDLQYQFLEKQCDVAAILSGPEPQRTYLEKILRPQLEAIYGKAVLVRGIIENLPTEISGNLTIYPYLDRQSIGTLLNRTDVVICRSGYSSLMDLLHTGTKAILIPTPGQPEQEYLGSQMQDHPQFVVQQQKHVNIEAGLAELRARPDIEMRASPGTLLEVSITGLLDSLR